jgi:purine-binding chemotaxis protein CheW
MTIKRKINNTVVNEYLTFILGSMKYAIELLKIKKILTYPELITILPNTNDLVK